MSDARVGLLRREVGRAWESLVMDEAMRNQGNTSKEEAWLVLHFLEHAQNANAYPPKSVAIVTTHYAQMLWLQHCVWEAGRRLHGDQAYECVQMIATVDRYQGLQAPVVLASLVSNQQGPIRAASFRGLSRLGRVPPHCGLVEWAEGDGCRTAEFPFPRRRTEGAAPGGYVPTAHPCPKRGGRHLQVQGGGVGGGGAVALETVEEACQSP